MNKEELLAKARKDYPKGTKFKSSYDTSRPGISNGKFRLSEMSIAIAIFTGVNAGEAIYYKYNAVERQKNKCWAEITSSTNPKTTELNYEIY